MANVSTFFVRSIGRAWRDDPQVLTQSSENVDVNVSRLRDIGVGPVDDETVLRCEDERLEPFHGTTLVPPSCSLQRTVVLDRLQHTFLYGFLASKPNFS